MEKKIMQYFQINAVFYEKANLLIYIITFSELVNKQCSIFKSIVDTHINYDCVINKIKLIVCLKSVVNKQQEGLRHVSTCVETVKNIEVCDECVC